MCVCMGSSVLAATSSDSGGGRELKQQTCAGDSFAAPRLGVSRRETSERCCCVQEDVVTCAAHY